METLDQGQKEAPKNKRQALASPSIQTKLGFDKIRDFLVARAVTERGKEACANIQPYRKQAIALADLDRVEECANALRFDDAFYLEYPFSVEHLLAHAAVEGNWLNTKDFFELMKWLRMVRELISFFRQRKEKYPNINLLLGQIDWDKSILQSIEAMIDESGTIKDGASPKLKELRKAQAEQLVELRRTMQAVMRNAVANGWSDAAELTIRNDRLVIPMKADYKGRIKGFVHDVSQSGQTIFIEPSSALEANNHIRQLALQEHNEIVRILMGLTAGLRQHLDMLKGYSSLVLKLDVMRAKARLAVDLKATKPRLLPPNEELMLVKAKHPLLILKDGMNPAAVVPLSLKLSPEKRVLLVSGPNAGGKSVTIKTLGLLQMMAQSGLLIPADESTELPWFHEILVDIGDEQSIQSDLSTYTSHLQNMRQMDARLRPGTLFLLDEFGAGTDPKLGGAIAEAFLARFLRAGAYGMVTTHYGNLKAFADQHDGIVNAAMQFDPETLSPTFKIELGIPGRSYAFEIAKNVGVPAKILDDARSRIQGDQLEIEDLLLKLESQKHELEQVIKDNRSKNEELAVLLRKNTELGQKLKDNEAKIMKEAHQQAQALIDAANAKIERTIKEIRESQADKEKTKNIRRELAEMLPNIPEVEAAEILEELPELEEEMVPEPLPGESLTEGDWVMLPESNSYGRVLEFQGKKAVVALGEMRTTVKTKNLVKIKAPKSNIGAPRYSRQGEMVAKKANISLDLDVKGMRVEAAMPLVQRFIDEALLASLSEVRILHGKGTGALRSAIRDFLATIHEVASFEDAHLDAGGAGWTIVNLNHR